MAPEMMPISAGGSHGLTPRDREVSEGLIKQLTVLGHHRRAVVGVPFLVALVALVISFALPKTYTATAKILPPQQAQSATAALLSQLGGSLAGFGGALGIKNPSDLYVGMLRSDSIANALIARFGLKEAYRARYLLDARRELRRNTRLVTDKSGIIAIEVQARDPELAAGMANAYVEELHKLTGRLAVTEASQRRMFFEQQLQQTKDKLADSEIVFRQAIDSGGLVSVDAQGRATLETVARLRAQLSVKEVQIGAMRAYATSSNPELRRAEQEAAALRIEVARLESGAPSRAGEALAGREESTRGVNNIRLLRDVKYNEIMFELLAKQYELARLDESKDAAIVQVLDPALPPEQHSGPRRLALIVLATACALAITVVVVLGRNAYRGRAADPSRVDSVFLLARAWGMGRRKST